MVVVHLKCHSKVYAGLDEIDLLQTENGANA